MTVLNLVFKFIIEQTENCTQTKDKKIMTQAADINLLNALVKGQIPECNMKIDLETALSHCHRDDYHEEYCYKGFYLMLMEDIERGVNRKFFWKIIGPTGKEYELPQLKYPKKSFTYSKPNYAQYQVMVQIIKVGERI